MPYLLAQDIPSIDDYLCEIKDHGYLRKPLNGPETRFLLHDARRLFTHLIYKGASSIANQFKNGLVSVEDLTFIGWDVEPAFLNTQMLFELALGANLMTPHAYYYTIGDRAHRRSLRGLRERTRRAPPQHRRQLRHREPGTFRSRQGRNRMRPSTSRQEPRWT